MDIAAIAARRPASPPPTIRTSYVGISANSLLMMRRHAVQVQGLGGPIRPVEARLAGDAACAPCSSLARWLQPSTAREDFHRRL